MMSYGLGLAACCIIASSCGSHEGYAGLTKRQAMNAAEAVIAKNDYGANRAYFSRKYLERRGSADTEPGWKSGVADQVLRCPAPAHTVRLCVASESDAHTRGLLQIDSARSWCTVGRHAVPRNQGTAQATGLSQHSAMQL